VPCSVDGELCPVQKFGSCALFRSSGAVPCSELRELCPVQKFGSFALFRGWELCPVQRFGSSSSTVVKEPFLV
jgi:hypothetical protein